ncbi:DUF3800 domain-containing protein [Shinella sp. 838]|uniref:DUF3800 domain-containing protein n=1 Tax=Shinella sp. 838 TaxID=3038164 RepID=UPI002414EFB6|nr:DUF3800 domain-containing protein [Shinella sp. 838]MDG4671742.1 DUF3800 domain-containing protein [Shinella sp. 838]
MAKRTYILYCDESAKKGTYYSNFYGGAILKAEDQEAIERILRERKIGLNLYDELKWTKVTENYRQKYQEFIDTFFDLVAAERIKIRIMFTHNRFIAKDLTAEQKDNQYFLLYYQMLKHAFGLGHCNPYKIDRVFVTMLLDQIPHSREKVEKFRDELASLSTRKLFRDARVSVVRDQIADVDSKAHCVLQGLDIVLGSMYFRLNDLHLAKPEGQRRRGKRTVAKEKLYKHVNKRIRELYPNFNVGESTGTHNGPIDRWEHPYRHWKFKPRVHLVDEDVVKKRNGPASDY